MWGWGWLDRIASSVSLSLTSFLSAFVIGVLVGPLFFSWPGVFVLVLMGVCVFGASLLSVRLRLVLLCTLFLFGGIVRYQQSFLPEHVVTVADRLDKSVRIEALIVSDVDHRLSFQQAIVSDLRVDSETVVGKLLVRFPLSPSLRYGDQVAFVCRPEAPEPIEGFAYDRQLAAHGVLAVCGFPQYTTVQQSGSGGVIGTILAVRDALINRLSHVLAQPHAAFLTGLLFGGSSSLSTEVKNDFSRTGLSHILAASGFNVSICSILLLRILLASPLGKRRGLVVAFVLLGLYVLMAGATPAVVRAGVMAGLLLVQSGIGRAASMRNVFLFSLALMLLINPRLLLDDVGFQLSFAATAGLLFVLPRIEHWFWMFPKQFELRTTVVSSVVAIVCTLPIVLWHFGQISLIAPLVNLLVLPVIPWLMALSLVALIGSVFALPAYVLSFAVLRIVTLFSAIPFASISILSAKWMAGLSALLLIVLIALLYGSRDTHPTRHT